MWTQTIPICKKCGENNWIGKTKSPKSKKICGNCGATFCEMNKKYITVKADPKDIEEFIKKFEVKLYKIRK